MSKNLCLNHVRLLTCLNPQIVHTKEFFSGKQRQYNMPMISQYQTMLYVKAIPVSLRLFQEVPLSLLRSQTTHNVVEDVKVFLSWSLVCYTTLLQHMLSYHSWNGYNSNNGLQIYSRTQFITRLTLFSM